MQENSTTVRRLTEFDMQPARRALIEVNGRVVEEAALQQFLRDPSCYLLVAESHGALAGALNGYALRKPFRSEPQFLLYEVDVHREWRSQGIGKNLVSAFVDEARQCGAFEVWVLTDRDNQAAVRMYGQCGLSEEDPDAKTMMMNVLLENVAMDLG